MRIEFHTEPLTPETKFVVKPVLNTIESQLVTDSSFDISLLTRFQNDAISFTRQMFWCSPLDRKILQLEAEQLGIRVACQRDLHVLGRRYYDPQRMVFFHHPQDGQPLVMMAKVRPRVKTVPIRLGGRPARFQMSSGWKALSGEVIDTREIAQSSDKENAK